MGHGTMVWSRNQGSKCHDGRVSPKPYRHGNNYHILGRFFLGRCCSKRCKVYVGVKGRHEGCMFEYLVNEGNPIVHDRGLVHGLFCLLVLVRRQLLFVLRKKVNIKTHNSLLFLNWEHKMWQIFCCNSPLGRDFS